MAFSTGDWGGAFMHPIMKHYRHKKERGERHPDELPEHINIVSVTLLTDDEIDEHDADPDSDFDIEELSVLGEGNLPWLVTMSFVADGSPYEFLVYSDEEPSESWLKGVLSRYFTPS